VSKHLTDTVCKWDTWLKAQGWKENAAEGLGWTHSSSSELSPHSSMVLHFHDSGMHFPLEQWNWSKSQLIISNFPEIRNIRKYYDCGGHESSSAGDCQANICRSHSNWPLINMNTFCISWLPHIPATDADLWNMYILKSLINTWFILKWV
jgi:hypothetical protein